MPDRNVGRTSNQTGGRPRDENARAAILEAAYLLVRERGYAKVTTADIASRAGTGKQTIYRWWPTKFALVLDALAAWMQQIEPATKPPTTLPQFLVELCRGVTHAAPILRSLIAEAQHEPALRQQLKKQLIQPRRAALRRCLPPHRRDLRSCSLSTTAR